MKGTVLKPLSAGEVSDFNTSLIQQVPKELWEHPELVRRHLRNKRGLGKLIREALLAKVESMDLDHHLELWQRVYTEICGIEPQFQDVVLPENPGGFGWPVVVTPEVSLNQFWQGLQKKFTCRSYYGDDLEKSLDWSKQERDYHNGAYAIRVRDHIEADEELKNLSANDIERQKLLTMTLDERIRLEGLYWTLSSGQHLDVVNITLCSGSRSSDGSVPCVDWRGDDRGLLVSWYVVDDRFGRLRARAAVS